MFNESEFRDIVARELDRAHKEALLVLLLSALLGALLFRFVT